MLSPMASRVPAQYAVQGYAEHGDMHLDAGWRDYARGAYHKARGYFRGPQQYDPQEQPPPDTQAVTQQEPEMQAVEHAVDKNSARMDEFDMRLNEFEMRQEKWMGRVDEVYKKIQEIVYQMKFMQSGRS